MVGELIRISFSDALIVVDVQNDFIPGGSLPVPEGDIIIPGVNALMEKFNDRGGRVILTQDWHPPGHASFASAHPGKKPFDPIEGVEGIGPVLWPDHCVQGSKGAEFHPNLDASKAHAIIRKGYLKNVDGYSGFVNNDKKTKTGLEGFLKENGIKRIFVCGLALDYCVYWTATDGKKNGFEVFVVQDLTRGIASDSIEKAMKDMESNGIHLITSNQIT